MIDEHIIRRIPACVTSSELSIASKWAVMARWRRSILRSRNTPATDSTGQFALILSEHMIQINILLLLAFVSRARDIRSTVEAVM